VSPDREALPAGIARSMLEIALEEAKLGSAEGGVPIGAALFERDGSLLGRGHNRRVQDDDASAHAETNAFRNAGRRRHYGRCVMVTTAWPCWYCSGLVRTFGIGAVVIGESRNFTSNNQQWFSEAGIEVIDLDDERCVKLLGAFVKERSDLWAEDIGK
jgi:creatinine deaminase